MRPMKLIPDNTNVPFVKMRWAAFAFTLILTLGSLALLATRGLNFGVDFVGGVMVETRFSRDAPLDGLRNTVNGLGLGQTSIQEFGGRDTVLIRLPLPPGDAAAIQRVVGRVQQSVKGAYPDAQFRRVETVSGKVSGELIRRGLLAVALAVLGVAVFSWLRFEWHFGVSTFVALVHDVTVTLGFFALTQWEFDLNIVAAVLTIIGYSLNDKVVVDDRIRENLRKYRKMDMKSLVDLSVNETLSRTVTTSISLILALGALLVLGGEVLRGFTAAMLLGIFVGTFSSVYVSAPILIWLKVRSDSFLPKDAKPGTAERMGERVTRAEGLPRTPRAPPA